MAPALPLSPLLRLSHILLRGETAFCLSVCPFVSGCLHCCCRLAFVAMLLGAWAYETLFQPLPAVLLDTYLEMELWDHVEGV